MSLKGASKSTLDAKLSYILGTYSYAIVTESSLQKASDQRHQCRKALLGWLSSNLEDGQSFPADSSFVWINDIIATNCTDQDDFAYVADLLIEREVDSPWIIRSNEDTTLQNTGLTRTSEILPKWHSPNCIHRHGGEASSNTRRQSFPEKSDTWDDSSLRFKCLGLAGFLPFQFEEYFSLEVKHESQLREWKAHIRIKGDIAGVSYLPLRVPHTSSTLSLFLGNEHVLPRNEHLLKNDRLFEIGNLLGVLLKRIDLALSNALTVILWLQQNNQCCDRLTFLRQSTNQNHSKISPVLESTYIPLEMVVQFANNFKEARAKPQPWSFWPFAMGDGSMGASMTFLPAASQAAGTLHREEGKDHSLISQEGSRNQELLGKSVRNILGLLDVGFSWPSRLDIVQELHRDLGQHLFALHMTALAAQFVCLVVQSYAQAHTGNLALTFLDMPISSVRLLGAGLATRGRDKEIVATLRRLTCLGGMTGNKVMVFAAFVWGDERESPEDSFDLLTTPQDLVDIWGPASFVPPDSNTDNLVEDIRAICIGGGIVHPQFNATEHLWRWHWSPGLVSKLLQDSDISDAIHRGPQIGIDRQIRIGARVQVNESCPLNQPEHLEHVQKQFQECLHLIGTSESRWALETVQTGAQIGQYGVPQFMFGWRKLPGVTIKQKYLSGNNPTMVNDLAQPWGLHVSLCTGVIARVRLQQVLATCINLFMSQRNPIMLEWEVLRDRHKMVEALQNKDLGEWMGKLPGNYAKNARDIIEELLTRLLPTGVDAENKLVVSWMHENSTLECLKIPCKGRNLWAQILSDSADLATIACITPSCLESPCHTNHHCQYLTSKETTSFQQRKSFEFVTSVKPFVLNYDDSISDNNVRTSWTLQMNKSYWIGKMDSMLLADVSKSPTVTPILSVRKSTMALSMYKRLRAKRMLRETNAEGAQHCVIISGGPVV